RGIAHLGLLLERARGGVVEIEIEVRRSDVLDHGDAAIRRYVERPAVEEVDAAGRRGRAALTAGAGAGRATAALGDGSAAAGGAGVGGRISAAADERRKEEPGEQSEREDA